MAGWQQQQWRPPSQPWSRSTAAWPSPGRSWGTRPGPSWGPYQPPAARRRSGCGVAVLGCAGLFAFLLVALMLFSVALVGVETAGGPGVTFAPTPGSVTTPVATPKPPRPTPTPTGRPKPTNTPFTNDGYAVPSPAATPPPWIYPRTRQDALTYTGSSALYRTTTGLPVRCPYDPIVKGKNTDPATLEQGANRYIDCLMGVWRQPMADAGYPLIRPQVMLFGDRGVSPCGTRERSQVSGFYCSANAAIYIPDQQLPYLNSDGWVTYELEIVLGHEFAHHLQAFTGILGGVAYMDNNGLDTDLGYSRRLELQAQCFAGLATNATSYSMGMTPADRKAMQTSESRRGDRQGQPRTHGTPTNSGLWFGRGFGAATVGTCNTFAAPAAEID